MAGHIVGPGYDAGVKVVGRIPFGLVECTSAGAVAGIGFPNKDATPAAGDKTTVIAYMENWNDPDLVSAAWNEIDLNEMKGIVEGIEAEFGWDGDDRGAQSTPSVT